MDKKRIGLEDAIFDGVSDGLTPIDRPISPRVFALCAFIVVCVAGIVVTRVGYLFLSHSTYASRALTNAGQQTILSAPRGVIYDRFGEPLVKNEPGFSASLNASQLLKKRETIDEVLNQVGAILSLDAAALKNQLLTMDLERQAYLPLARSLTVDQLIEIKKLSIPSLVIQSTYSRNYVDGYVFSHVIGYTGLVAPRDLERDATLGLNDEIGKSGLEFQYDSFLRGVNGQAVTYKDAKGNELDTKTVSQSIAGDALYTTIDAGLQRALWDALSKQLSSLGRTAGVGLALNPQTGEVLALVSIPTFDNNNLTSKLFTDPSKPLFNRVVSGIYSPGSTIKPLVALAALQEHIVDPLFSVLSTGFIEIPNPYDPSKPSRFVDWKAHGWVNMYSALARSSNVYFYYVGGGFEKVVGLGIDRLKKYWRVFKLDEKTGIDLPSENSGSLPDPDIKEKRTGQVWRIGDTYNVSIGQGDLIITPLALLRYIASIANGGYMVRPFVVARVTDAAGGVVHETATSSQELEIQERNLIKEVQQGMIDAVTKEYGTAHMLSSIPLPCAGKTGSAQIQNNQKVNAFVVAYCGIDLAKPDIALLVLIEDAKEGSLNAVPVVQKVLQWYYDNSLTR